jgi:hypothetical protein
LDTRYYRYALVENKLLALDDCFMADILAEKNIKLYLWGEETSPSCKDTEHYNTIAELRKLLEYYHFPSE